MALTPNRFTHKKPKVIDVSHWEGTPDWYKVMSYDDRPDGVICKATDYFGNVPYYDKTWIHNRRELRALCVNYGAYHYFHPEYDATKQAMHFVNYIKDDPGKYAPVIDLEQRDYRTNGGKWVRMPKGASMVSVLKTFLEIVEKEIGKVPMIYTSASWVYEHLVNWMGQNVFSGIERYPLWVASYPYNPDLHTAPLSMPKGWSDWHLWQYSEAGVLQGFPYDGVDLNVASPLFDTGGEPYIPPVTNFPISLRVTSLATPWLNIRSGPGTNYQKVVSASHYRPGTIVNVYDIVKSGNDEWARVGDSLWCAKQYSGRVYLEPSQ